MRRIRVSTRVSELHLDVFGGKTPQSVSQHLFTLVKGQQPISHTPQHLTTQLGCRCKLVLWCHALQQCSVQNKAVFTVTVSVQPCTCCQALSKLTCKCQSQSTAILILVSSVRMRAIAVFLQGHLQH